MMPTRKYLAVVSLLCLATCGCYQDPGKSKFLASFDSFGLSDLLKECAGDDVSFVGGSGSAGGSRHGPLGGTNSRQRAVNIQGEQESVDSFLRTLKSEMIHANGKIIPCQRPYQKPTGSMLAASSKLTESAHPERRNSNAADTIRTAVAGRRDRAGFSVFMIVIWSSRINGRGGEAIVKDEI